MKLDICDYKQINWFIWTRQWYSRQRRFLPVILKIMFVWFLVFAKYLVCSQYVWHGVCFSWTHRCHEHITAWTYHCKEHIAVKNISLSWDYRFKQISLSWAYRCNERVGAVAVLLAGIVLAYLALVEQMFRSVIHSSYFFFRPELSVRLLVMLSA